MIPCDDAPMCCPPGSATVELGPADDIFAAGPGSQCVLGAEGDDDLAGGPGSDAVLCGPGDDECAGDNGSDVVSGGDGDDRVLGNNGSDELFGGNGADVLEGGNGTDHLRGGPGIDIMLGGNGKDTFVIADLCETGPGETIDGGNGKDTLLTAVPVRDLQELGVEIVDVETIEEIEPLADAECELPQPAAIPIPGFGVNKQDVLCAVLAQTAAVVEGEVTDTETFTFDDRPDEGPRQVVLMTDVDVLLGTGVAPGDIRLRLKRGEVPELGTAAATGVSIFVTGQRYVVFLRNTSWRNDPTFHDFVFRRDNVGGQEILVDQQGFAVADAFGGAVIARMFEPAKLGAAPVLIEPSPRRFDLAVTPEQHRVQLGQAAAACQEPVLQGVFIPFSTKPWNVFRLSRPELPI